jgi:hypothetical protein
MDKRKADNTMDKRKRTKRQTIIHRDWATQTPLQNGIELWCC